MLCDHYTPAVARHTMSLLSGRDPPQEVHLAGGGNLVAHIAEALRAPRRADVWPAGLVRRNARVLLSDAVSHVEATADDLDAELEVRSPNAVAVDVVHQHFSCQSSGN